MWVSLKSQRFLIEAEAHVLADELSSDPSGRFKDVWIHDDDDGFYQVFYKSFFFRVWQLKCKGIAVPFGWYDKDWNLIIYCGYTAVLPEVIHFG